MDTASVSEAGGTEEQQSRSHWTDTDRTKTTQTQEVLTLAVNSHRSVRALTDVQEAVRDDVTGRATVQEEEVMVLEAGVSEALGVVDLLVQTHNSGHVVFPKVRKVRLGGMQRVTCRGQSDHKPAHHTQVVTLQ